MSANTIKEDNWCTNIKLISKPIIVGSSISNKINTNNNKIFIKGELNKLNDEIEYKFKIKNCGTIDAIVYSYKIDGLVNDDKISYEIKNLKESEIIKKDKEFILTIKNLKDEKQILDFYIDISLGQYGEEK